MFESCKRLRQKTTEQSFFFFNRKKMVALKSVTKIPTNFTPTKTSPYVLGMALLSSSLCSLLQCRGGLPAAPCPKESVAKC